MVRDVDMALVANLPLPRNPFSGTAVHGIKPTENSARSTNWPRGTFGSDGQENDSATGSGSRASIKIAKQDFSAYFVVNLAGAISHRRRCIHRFLPIHEHAPLAFDPT